MSTRVLCLATRDLLRSDLTNFYSSGSLAAANCRVMLSHCPTPNCGEEFIAIYGASHRPRDPYNYVAIEEEFGIVVAVTRRCALVPGDHRGEAAYLRDDSRFMLDWEAIESRCREIVGLIDKNYQLLRNAELLFSTDQRYGFQEPLVWTNTDAQPEEVGAEHFCAYHAGIDQEGSNELAGLPGMPQADDVYGLLMHVRFDHATRFQHSNSYDKAIAP